MAAAFRYPLWLLMLLAFGPAAASAQGFCTDVPEGSAAPQLCDDRMIVHAETVFRLGRFDSVKVLLCPCIPTDRKRLRSPFAGARNTERALRMLALTYYAEDAPEASREAIKLLLDVNDNFRADAETDPQFFIDEVRRERPTFFQRPIGRLTLAGGGVAAAAIVGLLISRGGDDPLPPLAGPPGLPPNPGGN